MITVYLVVLRIDYKGYYFDDKTHIFINEDKAKEYQYKVNKFIDLNRERYEIHEIDFIN